MEISKHRLEVLKKIEDYETKGLFDLDVENDPPTRPLKPGEVDYVGKKRLTRIATLIANKVGQRHFEKMLKTGSVVLRDIKGQENLQSISDRGALITCNHFNPFDNYAVYKAICPILEKRNLYKIIREGNYTSFKGLYGYLFRHCNTLPLSSSISCMKEFMSALGVLLERGEKILIYPEQAMWYNYKKPRPLKLGCFRLAAKNNVPVLPIFITLEDTDKTDTDGLIVQAYTVNILPAIFPDESLTLRERTEKMCRENYKLWKETYESFYGIPLEYTTPGEVNICSI